MPMGSETRRIISMVWGQDVPETGTRASFPKLLRGYNPPYRTEIYDAR
jgi:hypothetical protein